MELDFKLFGQFKPSSILGVVFTYEDEAESK